MCKALLLLHNHKLKHTKFKMLVNYLKIKIILATSIKLINIINSAFVLIFCLCLKPSGSKQFANNQHTLKQSYIIKSTWVLGVKTPLQIAMVCESVSQSLSHQKV